MIKRLVEWALSRPKVAYGYALLVLVVGLFSYKNLNVEAYPNPVPPLVEVIAQPNGMSPEDVERYVTIPLETAFAGMPGLEHVRSQSLFGLADVKCYFQWGTDFGAARQEVLNRIQAATLPAGVEASISPWNAIGEVFRYELVGKGYTLKDLKTAQDFTLERQFKQVPGVIDVVSFGGETKQYEVNVDPFRLRSHNINLTQLMVAIGNANQNVGGQRLSIGEQAYTVVGIGLVKNVHDIEDVVVAATNGVPVRVRDVATVSIGFAPRLGIVGHDDNPDIVQGVVLMRYGGETKTTLEGIHAKVDAIRKNHMLPPGMDLVPYYDRGVLVETTTHTVLENLVVGMGLVSLMLWLFLGHTRAAIITAINIPLALLFAFIGMVATHTSANLISLGAVDFGIVVDSTVIMVESIFSQLGKHGKGTMRQRIAQGAEEVARPLAFSTLILGVAFLPLFTMTGVSGVIFAPMAKTYALAIGGAMILALTLTPVLATKALEPTEEEGESKLMRVVRFLDRPFNKFVARAPRRAAIVFGIASLGGLASLPFLGGEFMPKLEEGNFWIRATLPTSISLEKSGEYVGRMRAILRGCPEDPKIVCTDQNRKHPEIATVVSQLGRPDDGTDVAGFQNVELFAPLRPQKEWRRGVTKKQMTDELSKEMADAFPGVTFAFSQMISDNVEEALSGVKGENSIKVFGPNARTNEALAKQISGVLADVPGIRDLSFDPSSGQPSIRIVPDRAVCSRYGLNTGDVETVIEAAIGGKAVTRVLEGEKYFAVTVRWLEPYRASLEAIREITVATPDGAQVPLGQLASITLEDSLQVIFREDTYRYTPVRFSVRERDIESTILDAKTRIAAKVQLPYDAHLEFAGQMNELAAANRRLFLVVPISLLIILLIIKYVVSTWRLALVVFLHIPMACAGGMLMLLVTGTNLSVSASMGFISAFGIAIQNALLIISRFRQGLKDGLPAAQAALTAGEEKTRSVLMTTLVALFGLLPAALSNGIGSETQKPLALVVIGGALVLAVPARFFVVALIWVLHRNWKPEMDEDPVAREERLAKEALAAQEAPSASH